MIEIIREEAWDKTREEDEENKRMLPKDIRQMGKPDIGERIYVEDRAYRKLHDYSKTSEKTAYVLLGGFENHYGKQCVFVEAAIRLAEMTFDGELPVWNDTVWAYIYKKLCRDYDNMVIVGWAMDIRGRLPNMTSRIEKLHNSNFGGTHQVLFLMDSLEKEEAFYSNAGGHLQRREGFYVYYDKIKKSTKTARPDEGKAPAPVEKVKEKEHEKELEEYEAAPSFHGHKRAQGVYRRQVLEKEKGEGKTFFSPGITPVVLTLLICVLGFGAYRNYQKMNAMEETLAQMNTVQTTATVEPAESNGGVKVEDVTGNIEPAADTESQLQASETGEADAEETAESEETADAQEAAEAEDEPEAEEAGSGDAEADTENRETEKSGEEKKDTDESVETAQEMSESRQYLEQGYYIVQKGDNLAEICRKIYQSAAMQDKLCEANGIDDPDSIYAGQYLTLPD